MQILKTTALGPREPQDVAKRRGGGQPGNTNALKHGRFAKDKRALARHIAQWRRATRALIAAAARELSLRGKS